MGKAVTSKKGVLGDGDGVMPEYFANGQDTIDSLVEKGYLAKA